jgi:prepilin-type N-terminal cleavage/methylation domain-containing protein
MKNKHDGGFSLIEVVLAMVILALIVVPTCTSLVLSFRVNAKAEAMLQAQLAVSSAVEQLMAKKINDTMAAKVLTSENDTTYDYVLLDENDNAIVVDTDQYPDVEIVIRDEEPNDGVYCVIVKDNNDLVTVTTYIRGGGMP